MTRSTKTILVSALLALWAPASASAAAGSIDSIGNGAELVAANDGTVNDVRVTTAAGRVTFEDSESLVLTPDADVICDNQGAKKVVCAGPGVVKYRVTLGPGSDKFRASGPLEGFIQGREGADVLTGGEAAEDLEGGPGHDTVTANGGNDEAEGGDGADADILSMGAGSDTVFRPGAGSQVDLGPDDDSLTVDPSLSGAGRVQGGSGFDSILSGGEPGPAVGMAIDLGAGTLGAKSRPFSLAISGFESVAATVSGGDTIFGTAGANLLRTGSEFAGGGDPRNGNDVIDPRSGPDLVLTGAGNDTITTADGFLDTILCGPGADTVNADQTDELEGCETVAITRVRPAVADTRAAACSLRKGARKAKRSSFLKGYSATFRCDERVTVVAQLKARGVILAERTTSAGAGAAKKLTLKPGRRLRGLVGKRFTARVVIQARDEFGNTRTLTRKVKVTTPKRKKARR